MKQSERSESEAEPVGPWAPTPPVAADHSVRACVRQLRRSAGRLLVALDDDPTGSQAVHGLEVVMVDDPAEFQLALSGDARSCFVLTNTRSQPESDAVTITGRVAGELFALAAGRDAPLDLVSRSDSTLRGHVLAEITALDAARKVALGHGYDAVLFAPAFLEAGRVTADDIHWAQVSGEFIPVGSTEFAKDATFGFSSSNLRDFLIEVGRGTVKPEKVSSLSLSDIRIGGPDRVAEILSETADLDMVVVNALVYADLEVVALGALRAADRGKALLYRSGPSLVRALDGQDPILPLGADQIWAAGTAAAASTVETSGAARNSGHGLVVVGSHVGQTSRQIQALQAATSLAEIVLDVPALLDCSGPDERAEFVAATATRVGAALADSHVLLYTSRSLITGDDGEASLLIARTVSAAVSDVVRLALDAGPAWVVGKGGITSHDVAMHGLGIRRAQVVGQLFPGLVSVFRALDADPRAIGRPYVVFAGNVGGDDSLTEVVGKLMLG